MRRTTIDIIETGCDLILVKNALEHGMFNTWINTEFGMTDRTAQNCMRAAAWAESKYETVSRLPPATVYLLAAKTTPEEIKTKVIADIEAGKPINARDIKVRIKAARADRHRGDHHRAGQHADHRRADREQHREREDRIKLPEGMTAEEACRAGLKLETTGDNAEAAARTVGISVQPYRLMRYIVWLAENPDLSPKDHDLAQAALAHLNETSAPTSAYEMIAHIADRVWGTGSKRLSAQKANARRVDNLERAMGFITQMCAATANIDMPQLDRERTEKAGRDLQQARRELQHFYHRIMEPHE